MVARFAPGVGARGSLPEARARGREAGVNGQ